MGSTSEGHESMSHVEEASGRYEHDLGEVPKPEEKAVDQDVITPLASDDTNSTAESPSHDCGKQDITNSHGQHIPTATGVHGSLSIDGYYQSLQHKPSWRIARGHPASTQSSSGSLHALSEHGEQETGQYLGRTLSSRSIQSRNRGRSASHSKSNSISATTSKRLNIDHPVYPEQSFASLSNPMITSRPHPILRTRSSHPAQNLLYNDMSTGTKLSPSFGRKTADNTPISSPGLFTPTSVRTQFDSARSGSPQLHHLQTPKETDRAEIDHDMFSGNKFINHYEVVHELGRGEHGKVKLGRDMEKDSFVAIKIVPRYSAKRRLGKLGAPEDRTKREVAILKKARHPHVVSLLEVIDDPNKNKVYLILEFVEKGEIKWRKHGVKEICAINNRRFDEERLGVHVTLEPTDRDCYTVRQAQSRHDRLEYARTHGIPEHVPNWSLEYAGDTDDESDIFDLTRTMSRQVTGNSIPSRGNSQDDYVGTSDHLPPTSAYGSFTSEQFRNHRKFSVAASAVSHMSSEPAFDQDDDQHSFVPALTMEEARRTFRDTLLGLEFLHFIGIIHRDIKPANLLASSIGQVKISDFGVSYLGRPTTEEEADNKVAEKDATPLDNEKELARSVGTPAFWAPEVCYEDASMFADGNDPKITGALDLWALGITLYCMIYARLPFYGGEYMGLHEAVCTEDVFCPRTRLVPVDTTNSEFISRSNVPISSSKRLDYELKFEQVPDHVRDLIKRLLTKDPAYRITINEAKRHPWVVEGISDQTEWLHSPEIEIGGKKILEINDKELSHAVVKRSFIERGLSAASRIAGSLLGRSKDGRKRSTSTVASAGSSTESLHSPATSTTSTVGKIDKVKEARRQSLRGDELVQALKASREPSEHPLAQSQTASPEIKDQFQNSYFAPTKALSTGHTPAVENESRPRGPDRGLSVLSTAESVKTIRASQFQRGPTSDSSSNTEVPVDSSIRSRVGGLWEGTAKTFTRLGSRDRRSASRSRSRGRTQSESDGHAGPSLAVSKTYAAGAIQTPNVLKAIDIVNPSPARSPIHHSPFRTPASAESEYEQAQQMNKRRHIQEAQHKMEAASRDRRESIPDVCPPSPDDITFLEQSIPSSTQISPAELSVMQTAQSASTIASSLEAFDNSSVSAPSYGINSGASSPPEGGLTADYKDDAAHRLNIHTSEYEPEFMRTADTVTLHGRPVPASVTGKPLQDEHEYYDYGEDDDCDSEEEEGIVMGGLGRH